MYLLLVYIYIIVLIICILFKFWTTVVRNLRETPIIALATITHIMIFYIKKHNLEVIGYFLASFDPLIRTICLNRSGGL